MYLLPLLVGLVLLHQAIQSGLRGGIFVAAQQCYLKLPPKSLASPSNESNPSASSSADFSPPQSQTVTSGVVVPTTTSTPAFDYGNDKIRGVNLYGELSFVWILWFELSFDLYI